MTNHYKQMCLYEICQAFSILLSTCQAFSILLSALNRFRTKYSVFLDSKWKDLAERTPTRQRTRKTEAKSECLEFNLEAFDSDDALYPKGRYATQCIAYESPE